MLVELDIFSGRVNPSWDLDAPREERLRALHQQLPPSSGTAPEPPALGYRGFRYVLDGVPFRAWNGTVWGPARGLRDRDRAIERLLLEGCPPEDENLRARVERELGT
jgi:hypothetical protein